MKPTAFLINTARGGLVDQDALAAALAEGRIAGAGLDTFVPEPLPPGHPLLESERALLTPHVAFYSEESVHDVRVRAARGGRRGAGRRAPRRDGQPGRRSSTRAGARRPGGRAPRSSPNTSAASAAAEQHDQRRVPRVGRSCRKPIRIGPPAASA